MQSNARHATHNPPFPPRSPHPSDVKRAHAPPVGAGSEPAPTGLSITHVSRCVRSDGKRSPWRLLVVQASSLRASILATAVRCWSWPLVCRLLACATPATDALRCCPGFPAMMYRVGQNVIVRMVKPARYALHTRRSRGPHSNRCHPPVIASTAGAAAWLPHSKLRATHMMCA
ncbi:MAG: hypothetical protein KatS3mg056_2217 [Chloroflexus sp.]|nr:MAG: hypothetical protein KatS3mg056_2217 [Chloroflexus sp.]